MILLVGLVMAVVWVPPGLGEEVDCSVESERCCYSQPCQQDGLYLPPAASSYCER